ncbi:MAG: metal-dependent hydrolase [Methanobrevibacter sp.]|nr:metal-dependent hydrolase [Methanobrevibacter sp.]MBR0371812.1 metal-dependent hydrolase [Methanobrevibacter sp.]
MSSFEPHLIAGLTVGTIATGIFSVDQYPDWNATLMLPFLGGLCGALTPDMDIKSHSSMFMYLLYAIGATYLFFSGEPFWGFLLLLYSIIPQFFSHRGFIHSGVFGIISSLGIFAASYYNFNNLSLCITIATGYFFGFLSHILLDEA